MAKNSNNKKSYRFSIPGGLLLSGMLIALFAWLALTFHISAQLEKEIRTALIDQRINDDSPLYLELVEYKSSLFNGYIRTRIRSRNEELNTALDGFILKTRLEHGPLIISQDVITTGFARLTTSVDKAVSSAEANEWLERLFGDHEALKLMTVIDGQKQRHFNLETAALEYQVADITISIAAGKAKGSFNSDAESIPVNFIVDSFGLNQGGVRLESTANTIELDIANLEQGKINIPELKIHSDELGDTVLAGSSIKLRQQGVNSLLAGIRSQLITYDEDGEVANSSLSLSLANIQMDTVFRLVDQYEEQHNLQQQIEWTLEASADSQEGQDHLMALFQRREETILPRADTLVSQLINSEEGQVSFLLGTKNLEQDSYIRGDFAYNEPLADSSLKN